MIKKIILYFSGGLFIAVLSCLIYSKSNLFDAEAAGSSTNYKSLRSAWVSVVGRNGSVIETHGGVVKFRVYTKNSGPSKLLSVGQNFVVIRYNKYKEIYPLSAIALQIYTK